jgi:hypothetical protein
MHWVSIETTNLTIMDRDTNAVYYDKHKTLKENLYQNAGLLTSKVWHSYQHFLSDLFMSSNFTQKQKYVKVIFFQKTPGMSTKREIS